MAWNLVQIENKFYFYKCRKKVNALLKMTMFSGAIDV